MKLLQFPLGRHRGSIADQPDAVAEAQAFAKRHAEHVEEMADGLVRMMSHHDLLTALHLEATAELSARTAEHLGLSALMVDRCRLGARLHDIGKVAVDPRIINKPAKLTDAEWGMMKTHPVVGAELVDGLPLVSGLALAIRHHHERLDGRGYPDGLKGDDIPIEARVIAVTDAFHAMTAFRPYCKSMTLGDAFAELRRCAGSQFDESVVEAFIASFRTGLREMRTGTGPGFISLGKAV